jgi:hypothetical protein
MEKCYELQVTGYRVAGGGFLIQVDHGQPPIPPSVASRSDFARGGNAWGGNDFIGRACLCQGFGRQACLPRPRSGPGPVGRGA